MNKRDVSQEGKRLLDSEPGKAMELFTRIWQEYNESVNSWDAFYLLKSYRKAKSGNEEIEAEILERFGDDQQVKNIYMWLLFDRYVKSFDGSDPEQHEPGFLKLVEYGTQADLLNDSDALCPYTIAVNKILKAYKKPNFNVEKIGFWLSKLDTDKLSRKPSSYNDRNGKKVDVASDYETYFSTKAKYEFKDEKYEDCLNTSELALSTIEKFHYDNDIWFKRYRALSLSHMNRHEEAEEVLQDILSMRGGQKWFIYKEFADFLYEDENYEQALSMAINAALTGKDYDKKIDLFILLSKILTKSDRREEAVLHAKLAIAIAKNEGWKLRDKHLAMAKYFDFDSNEEMDFKQLLNDCQKIWDKEKWGKYPVEEGKITTIHQNGKSGFITSKSGQKRFFSKNGFMRKVKNLEDFEGAEVSYRLKEDEIVKEGDKAHAVQIEIVKMPVIISSLDGINVGDVVTGEITSVVDFGVFVKIGKRDGLLHISKLAKEISKENIKQYYKVGNELIVKIIKITNRGPELALKT